MQDKTFEELARECGDAMLVIRISTGTPGKGFYTIAHAVAGAFAVTDAQPGDIPLTKKRQPSKTRRFLITHAQTGLKVGLPMTRSEAMQTLVALCDVPAGNPTEINANRDRIFGAFPAKYGFAETYSSGPVNQAFAECVAPERAE